MQNQPLFIAIEGIDGSGKTTLCRHLRGGALLNVAPEALNFRDPGTTVIGEAIRSIALNESRNVHYDPLCITAEAALFLAAGYQLAHEVIRPTLADGRTVIQDRWRLSTLVYQGLCGKMTPEQVDLLGRMCTDFDPVQPDICIVLRIDPELAYRRIQDQKGRGHDRFEGRGVEYFRSVAAGYEQAAKKYQFPYPILSVDASGMPRDVLANVCRALKEAFGVEFNKEYLFNLSK